MVLVPCEVIRQLLWGVQTPANIEGSTRDQLAREAYHQVACVSGAVHEGTADMSAVKVPVKAFLEEYKVYTHTNTQAHTSYHAGHGLVHSDIHTHTYTHTMSG